MKAISYSVGKQMLSCDLTLTCFHVSLLGLNGSNFVLEVCLKWPHQFKRDVWLMIRLFYAKGET